MTDNPAKHLREQIKLRGQESYADKTFLNNLIADIYTDSAKLRNVLKIAVSEANMAARLAGLLNLDASRQIMGVNQAVIRLSEEYSIDDSMAAQAVRTLGLGIGLDEEVFEGLHEEAPAAIGDTVSFGGYTWRVLAAQDKKVFILCDRAIINLRYHEKPTGITWANCTLRKYLNEVFYCSFDPVEKNRIAETAVTNTCNPWIGTNGGSNTTDRIFILNIEEVVHYFGDSGLLQNGNPNSKFLIDDPFNKPRITFDNEESACWWWLRSPGRSPGSAAYVDMNGMINMFGSPVNFNGGVRPALWLVL